MSSPHVKQPGPKTMKPLNQAQRILITLGVDPQVVLLGHYREKSRSNTKKGPGRMHMNGKTEGK